MSLSPTNEMSKELRETPSQDITVTPVVPEANDGGYRKPKIGEGKWWRMFFEPGSAAQIVVAAAIAIGIGMAVNATVDTVPPAAVALVGIPGTLWLRALQAVVLPLIVAAMVLAVQRLKDMQRGGGTLAKWTVIYYVVTTILAIVHSTILVTLGWRLLFTRVDDSALQSSESDQELIDERSETEIHQVVVDMFNSFIPNNIVAAFANNQLLSVLITSIVLGYLIRGPDSSLLRAIREVERIITIIITFLIKLAPVGVFFLILSNIMRLDLAQVGQNLGVLIGAAIGTMAFHLFVVLPAIFFIFTRRNPYTYWGKSSQAWITAWGTASSAGTLPVTMKVVAERKVPNTVSKFTVPLGCLVNMDGTAIYFPIVIVFLAATQGITLNAAEYVIVVLLSTLTSIGVSPIPSASLVLIVMICDAIGLQVTSMYGVIVAIDWFIDRFRTMTNVSGDIYAAAVIAKITHIIDDPEDQMTPEQAAAEAQAMYERETRVG